MLYDFNSNRISVGKLVSLRSQVLGEHGRMLAVLDLDDHALDGVLTLETVIVLKLDVGNRRLQISLSQRITHLCAVLGIGTTQCVSRYHQSQVAFCLVERRLFL